MTTARAATLCLLACSLSGCELLNPPIVPPPPPPPSISIARLYERPAERAFIGGLRFYEDGQYDRAESLLKSAIALGLADRNDQGVAYKNLAFIACAYNRPTDCEDAFKQAFNANPDFRLSDAEVGHPIWGPVYKRVAAARAAAASIPPSAPPPATTKK